MHRVGRAQDRLFAVSARREDGGHGEGGQRGRGADGHCAQGAAARQLWRPGARRPRASACSHGSGPAVMACFAQMPTAALVVAACRTHWAGMPRLCRDVLHAGVVGGFAIGIAIESSCPLTCASAP